MNKKLIGVVTALLIVLSANKISIFSPFGVSLPLAMENFISQNKSLEFKYINVKQFLFGYGHIVF